MGFSVDTQDLFYSLLHGALQSVTDSVKQKYDEVPLRNMSGMSLEFLREVLCT